MAPLLSIVIPSQHRADLLARCLLSIQCHAPANTEVMVVDDGSPAGIISRVANSFPGVASIRLPHRQGFCIAVNAGLRAVEGSIVELLNDDTQVTATWTEAPLRCFQDPGVAAVAPLVLLGSPHDGVPTIDSAGDRYFIGGVAAKRGHGEVLNARYLQPTSVFGVSACAAFYRRTALEQVGGFPDSFGAYFEDVDLSFQLRQAGHRLLYEPASRVWHQGAASHGRGSRRLVEQQSRNEERVFWRNLPNSVLAQAVPWHAAVLMAKAWRRWREETFLPFVFGRLRVLTEFFPLMRHRQSLASCHSPFGSWGVERQYWA